MVDSCVLLVDVAEGPMAQTKYVLTKALNMRLRPLVVLNKMDRDAATAHRCDVVHSTIFDLFASLGADDQQLDFPIIYASGAPPAPDASHLPSASGISHDVHSGLRPARLAALLKAAMC